MWYSGIGIVNAIEVVTAFPENDGLQKFREWIESPDPTIFGKLDVNSGSNVRKRGPKGFDNDGNCAASCGERVSEFENSSQAEESEQSVDHSKNIKKTFMNKHVTRIILLLYSFFSPFFSFLYFFFFSQFNRIY